MPKQNINITSWFSNDVVSLLKRVGGRSPRPLEHWNGDSFTEKYLRSMHDLSARYGHLSWLPLAIPRFEIGDPDQFLELWDQHNHRVFRQRPDVNEPWTKEQHPWQEYSNYHIPHYRGLHLYHTDKFDIKDNILTSKLYKGKIPQFERLVEQVFEYFPLETFYSIYIWESQLPIMPHRDNGCYWQCPTEFRSMLLDQNSEPTLWVSEEGTQRPQFIDLPQDTNSFCWSNGKMLHGSTYHNKRKLILCTIGPQDPKKSAELFDRSIMKYPNYVH